MRWVAIFFFTLLVALTARLAPVAAGPVHDRPIVRDASIRSLQSSRQEHAWFSIAGGRGRTRRHSSNDEIQPHGRRRFTRERARFTASEPSVLGPQTRPRARKARSRSAPPPPPAAADPPDPPGSRSFAGRTFPPRDAGRFVSLPSPEEVPNRDAI